jgi:hypothetical protein
VNWLDLFIVGVELGAGRPAEDLRDCGQRLVVEVDPSSATARSGPCPPSSASASARTVAASAARRISA